MKKFLLFDNDGVLVETERWYYEANKIALGELGFELPFVTYMEIMARGGTAWEVAQKEGVDAKTIACQRAKRDNYYREFLTYESIEIDGVIDVLQILSQEYRMGIVTTSRRTDFELIHAKRGIVGLMDFTLCVEEYPRAKPYADPYIAGMKKFNASKQECLVIEDSQRGLTSACNAGIECAIVHNEFTKTHDFSKASHFLKTLKELPILLDSLARR